MPMISGDRACKREGHTVVVCSVAVAVAVFGGGGAVAVAVA